MTARPDRLTINDVAARLGVKPVTVRVYMHRKQLDIPEPTGRVGRTPWWSSEDIEPWLKGRGK